jgi:cytochrome P450
LRQETPVYYNERFDFYALSRWSQVEPALSDWDTYRSGRGTIFEIIRANVEIPPGIILFEDPPLHDIHRGVLARVFTPRRMAAIEPLVRQFCARSLDELVGSGGFDVIGDFAALLPMRTIGYLLGIPEQDQAPIRQHTDDALTLGEDGPADFDPASFDNANQLIAEYIDWRAQHPADDLMTTLLNAEVDDPAAGRRRLSRTEVLTYTNMIVGAGNETATRMIAFAVQLLAEHSDQRRELVEDRDLLPAAVEEVLRYEAPSPVQCRYAARDVDVLGERIAADAIVLLLNGSANRDDEHFPDADRFDIHRRDGAHLSFGFGLHYCLGAALARLEGMVALDELLKRWPEWQVDGANATHAHTASVRGWAKLPIVVP